MFSDPDKYKLWKTSYNAIMGIWGVSLYVAGVVVGVCRDIRNYTDSNVLYSLYFVSFCNNL